MRKEIVYSFLALGAIPVTVNAQSVEAMKISNDVLSSPNGTAISQTVGTLQKGNYAFVAKLTTRLYKVTIKIGGKTVEFEPDPDNEQDVNIGFTLKKATEVKIEISSAGDGASGSDFTVGSPVINLTAGINAAKQELTTKANDLKTKVQGWQYDNAADVAAVDNLLKKIADVKETYQDYVDNELYDTESGAMAKEIAALDNEVTTNYLNALCETIHLAELDAVAGMEAELVGASAYLLDDAKKELEDVDGEITAAIKAVNLAKANNKAVEEYTANLESIPTQKDLDDITSKYTTESKANKDAYKALDNTVKNLQKVVDTKLAEGGADQAFAANKEKAQQAVDAVKALVDAAYNSAAQKTLAETEAYQKALEEANEVVGQYGADAANYNAFSAKTATLDGLQKKLDDTKAETAKKVSKDGKYAADGAYYTDYLAALQKTINDLKTNLKKAYDNGEAASFSIANNVESQLNTYKTQAGLAVDNYDTQVATIAECNEKLAAARAEFENLPIYQDEAQVYDYKLKLDAIQKEINDVQAEIDDAIANKKGQQHWTAMKAVSIDGNAIKAEIDQLLKEKNSAVNSFNADVAGDKVDELNKRIEKFGTDYTGKLGTQQANIEAQEADIKAGVDAVDATLTSMNANSETLDYTAKVNTASSAWTLGEMPHWGNANRTTTQGGITMAEQWTGAGSDPANATGKVMFQKLTDVPNGVYTINLYASAADQATNCPNKDKTDIAFVYANGVQTPVKVTEGGAANVYTLSNVQVTDGTLEMGLAKAKGGTNWHAIQIKSLKATTASVVEGLTATLDDLSSKQDALEANAKTLSEGIAANKKLKGDANKAATDLEGVITQFKKDYGIEPNDPDILGNSYVEINNEETEIATKLAEAKDKVNNINPEEVSDADVTNKVGSTKDDWTGSNGVAGSWAAPYVNPDDNRGDCAMVENYNPGSCQVTGEIMSQTLTGLANGKYTVELYANAMAANNVDNDHAVQADANDVAYVFANDVKVPVVAKKAGSTSQNGVYKLENVTVSDGTLKMGIGKDKQGTNWHTIQIKSLTQLASTADTNKNLAEQKEAIAKLAEQQTALETKAKARKANAEAKATADTEIANLEAYELNNLKDLKDVSGADGNYSTQKAKKSDPKNWAVYRSGLKEGESYAEKKAALDEKIAKLKEDIQKAYDDKELNTKWESEFKAQVVDATGVKAEIDAIKKKAGEESDNYWAYRDLNKKYMNNTADDVTVLGNGTLDQAIVAAETDLATVAGSKAAKYYQDLMTSYRETRATILTNMRKSLNARTAVKDKEGYETQLKDLQTKVEAVQANAKANLDQYNEEVALLKETQDLWYATYAEIAATDETTARDNYLTQLDEIQKKIDAAKAAIETNVKNGQSVEKEQKTTLNGIKVEINNLKQQQEDGYNAQVAADSKQRYDDIVATIAAAREAYKKATATITEYNNAQSALLQNAMDAVEAETTNLVDALYAFPDESKALSDAVGEAYVKWSEREDKSLLFDKDEPTWLDKAEALKAQIEQAEEDFIDAVRAAVNADCAQKVENFKADRDAAAEAVNGYSVYAGGQELTEDEQKTLFREVDELIANIETAMDAPQLSELDEALRAAENSSTGIEAKLAKIKNDKAYTAMDAVLSKIEKAKDYMSEDEAAQVDEFRATLEEAKANGNVADNAALKAQLDDLKALAGEATGVVEANEAFETAAADLQEKLDAAVATASQFLAAPGIINELNGIQATLTQDKSDVEDINDNDDPYVAKKADIDDKTNEIEGLSDEIDNILGATLFDAQIAALEGNIDELEEQYVLFANDFETEGVQEQAKAYKEQIENIKKKLEAFKAVKAADKKVTYDEETGEQNVPAETLAVEVKLDEETTVTPTLLDVEQEIAGLVTELTVANNPAANTAAYNVLKNKADGLSSEIGSQYEVDNFSDEQKADIAAQKAAIDKAIEDVKAQIEAKKDNILPYAENIEDQIEDIKNQIAAMQAAVQTAQDELDEARADLAMFLAQTELGLDVMQRMVDFAKETIDAYKYTKAADFAPKFNMMQEAVDAKKAYIEEKLADATISEQDIDDMVELLDNNAETIMDVLNTAANRELLAKKANLQEQADAIEIDENRFTLNDLEYINGKKGEIENDLVALEGNINTAKINHESFLQLNDKSQAHLMADVLGDEIVEKVRELTGDPDFLAYDEENEVPVINPNIKQKMQEIQDKIDELKEFIDGNILPSTDNIAGDIDGDGEVTGDDVDAFVEAYMADTIPADDDPAFARYDANGDGEITIADAVAIFNLSNGLNWDGTDPDLVAARNADKMELNGTLTTQAEKLADGMTRISFNLDSNFDYAAFSIDVLASAGVKVVNESANVSLRTSNLANGTHRIAGLSLETATTGKGRVLTIDVEGEGSLQYANIVFATAQGQSIRFILGNATAINGLGADQQQTTTYDLGGKIVNGMKKGVSIVRDAYGNVKKKLAK